MLLTCRSFSWYSDSRVSVPRLHHGGNNGVWWHVPFKFVMVVVFLVVKKYLAKSKGKIKYQKLETVMYLQWGSRRGRVSNLCCRSPSQELSIQKKVISTVRVKRKKRKEKITLKYTARNAYLWAAHKRPTFQLEINFTSSLFIFPPVIKNIAVIWRIRVNRGVGMAVSAKSPNQEMFSRVAFACVLRTPIMIRPTWKIRKKRKNCTHITTQTSISCRDSEACCLRAPRTQVRAKVRQTPPLFLDRTRIRGDAGK